MKLLILPLCVFLLGAATVVIASPIAQQQQQRHHLLGARECTWGPSYWCYNITNAAGCNAVTHCIQTVWEKHAVPEDNDSICKICLDMVQQARDQLLSNGTQEDLRAVFEGSCKLIPLKPVTRLCIKTVDDFIPELVEALASQMNPQAVCSVAGLCNNAAIDKMLADDETAAASANSVAVTVVATPAHPTFRPLTCKQCNSIAGIITRKFRTADRDQLLERVLGMCGRLSSFSDACASLVLTHFNALYAKAMRELTVPNICHMSGTCVGWYHRHEGEPENDDDEEMPLLTAEKLNLEVRSSGVSGVRNVDDDIPCELCKQLVHHLKDLLIANTTEIEFKSVLEGLCKQTLSFKAECISIVDQYYSKIYETLLTDLNENEACCLIEICPRGLAAVASHAGGMPAPLLPVEQAQHLYVHITAKPKVHRRKLLLGDGEPALTASQVHDAQLPIDRLLVGPPTGGERLVDGGNWCVVCSYVAHFVQTALANTQTEEEVKTYAKQMCENVTPKLRTQCDAFIDTYGDALIALAIQQVDPREICPRMFVCPASGRTEEAAELLPIGAVAINEARTSTAEKCPLCLLAVAQAVAAVKADRSVQHIEYVLGRLCSELPGKMKAECEDFVESYTPELVRMLADDFSPQAICVNLKLCDEKRATRPGGLQRIGGDIATNEIPDHTVNGQLIDSISLDVVGATATASAAATPNCLLCEELVRQVEKRVSNKKSRAQLKEALEHACAKMPKLTQRCDHLVDVYGDRIVDLIIAEFTPKQICRELGQCMVTTTVQLEFANARSANAFFGASGLLPASPTKSTPAGESDSVALLAEPDMAYVQAADSNACVICQTVMQQLEIELKDKNTQKQIEDTVKNVCHQLPKAYDAQCSKFIDAYAALIITLIDSTPPKQICGMLSLCSVTPACRLCKVISVQLETDLVGKKTTEEIQAVVQNVCKHLLEPYQKPCDQFVAQYHRLIVSLVDVTPTDQICAALSVCPVAEAAPKRPLLLNEGVAAETPTCRLCKVITDQLETDLAGKKTTAEYQQVVQDVCKHVPVADRQQCEQFIAQYHRLMVSLIDVTPTRLICASLSVCPLPDERAAVAQEAPVAMETKREIAECAVCHAASLVLLKVLEDPTVQRSVEQVADRTCNRLPGAYNDRCLSMMHAYGQSMLNIVERNSGELQTLCTQIGMCHPNEFRSFAQIVEQ